MFLGMIRPDRRREYVASYMAVLGIPHDFTSEDRWYLRNLAANVETRLDLGRLD